MVKSNNKRLFVLDTNVLLHDPSALFNFQEHDIYIPMMVLEELDGQKKGTTEVARNARESSRIMEELMASKKPFAIHEGILLKEHYLGQQSKLAVGKLFFQVEESDALLPKSLPGNKTDNNILATTLTLQKKHADCEVVLVSKDINLRIKASILGIIAEDYYTDRAIEDISGLFRGYIELPENFWETFGKDLDVWQEEGRTFYRIKDTQQLGWCPNQFIYHKGERGFEAIVRRHENQDSIVELITDFRHAKHAVWGIQARNLEQNFALNLLMDPEVDFVSLMGIAGTGKTLLALAAGLMQTLEHKLYREIIMTRVTLPLGEDIGFLPGTEEEKMTPWMGALMDNLEVLHCCDDNQDWQTAVTTDLIRNRIKIRSLNFMRGRTFLQKYIIIDEAQNLTSKQMKALITRAGPGTKLICIGDVKQIDSPYLTETTSGLTYAVDRFKSWQHSGHITLARGERSRLADFAAENL